MTEARSSGPQTVAGRAWRALLACYPLLLVLAVWEVVAQAGFIRPLFLPTLSAVGEQFGAVWADGELVTPLVLSLYRAFAGLALATAIGIVAGIMMARSRAAHWLLDPLVSIGFPAPKIAFVPIFILWFGIDSLSKILLVAFSCVFPIIVATYHGASAIGRTVIWSAEAMGTPERKMLTRVIVPAALPAIFSGVRVTLPVALITAFTAEMIGGGGGVGAALMYAQRFFQTPTVFVYILLMLLSGLILDRVMLALRARLIPWERDGEALV